MKEVLFVGIIAIANEDYVYCIYNNNTINKRVERNYSYLSILYFVELSKV